MINKPLKICCNIQFIILHKLCLFLFLFIAEGAGAASSSLMSVPTGKAMVRKQKLQEVAGDNGWKINNILDNQYRPRSPRIIVEEALRQVDTVIEYSVYTSNCEHFATNQRYGQAESRQVLDAVATHSVIAVKFFRGL
uniref:LRAT domain-containing protein n=1 Tax=Sparus aurata TaxID=8175 RepID=A0A671WQ71_SPAAU